MGNNVNIPPAAQELEQAFRSRLADLVGQVEWLEFHSFAPIEYPRWDIAATLGVRGGAGARLVVECKRSLTPAQFEALAISRAVERTRGLVPILAIPYVSPRLAEVAQRYDWGWYDLAGNCRIEVPGLLLLERDGHPARIKSSQREATLASWEAARVVRALLTPEHAGRLWTQRSLQTECAPAVSLGLVNKVVRLLQDQSMVSPAPGRTVRDPEALLRAWTSGYRFQNHARRRYFSLLRGARLSEALVRLGAQAPGRAAYASFSAADLQAPHVRQSQTWLFLAAEAEDLFQEVIEARRVDSGENLVVLIPADEGVFYRPDARDDRLMATNPVQTYADLVHSGGRGEEAAAALLAQTLAPAWSSQDIAA